MTADTKAKVLARHVIRQVSQKTVQVASRIRASALVAQAVATVTVFHVVSVRQLVVVVQVAAKAARQIVLTAAVKVVQTVATVVKTHNIAITND